MSVASFVCLENSADCWLLIHDITVTLGVIVPSVGVAPRGRNRATRPSPHGVRPPSTVAPGVGVAFHMATHIETANLGRFGIRSVSEPAQSWSSHCKHSRHWKRQHSKHG